MLSKIPKHGERCTTLNVALAWRVFGLPKSISSSYPVNIYTVGLVPAGPDVMQLESDPIFMRRYCRSVPDYLDIFDCGNCQADFEVREAQ